VVNLWDVTDRDIDKFCQSVFDKTGLSSAPPTNDVGPGESLCKAIAESRDACKLKYLTGAAPVVYGIPLHL
jgi:separase